MLDEAVCGIPLAEHEGVVDEQVTRRRWIDAVVANGAPADDRQPVERHRFRGDRPAGLSIPTRLAVGALDDVVADALGPFRLHGRHPPRPQPIRFHELGRHHPTGRLLRQHGTGGDDELRAGAPAVLTRVVVTETEVRQQAGEDGLVDVVGMAAGAGFGTRPRPATSRRPDTEVSGDLT